MAKSIRQKEKLLRIVELLEEYTDDTHFLSAKQIIEKLSEMDIEVERKALYDDIFVLQGMGYDIMLNNKRNGGYYLCSRRLERSEILPLADAVSCSRFITEKKSRDIISKLESFLSVYDRGSLNRNIYVENRVKSENEAIFYSVDSIYEAINHSKKISYHYCEYNMKKELVPRKNGKLYVVCPLNLLWSEEKYYLIAYDEYYEEIRHYRVDKIKDIVILDETFKKEEYLKGFDMANYSNRLFSMFGGQEESITLRFPEKNCGIFIDRFGKDITFRKLEEGYVSGRFSVSVSSQFFGWLSGLGPEVQMISPQNVINDYKDFLNNLLKNY